ncbi:hypothetical protein COCSUDRAFT_54709 [Coccomyxa subellipsoidea C-169]|uniref:Uncharacterized protein n=1 Tax=Coccomyxa subellipsoidea (strain C-169) TaxID=574566 RepID=I0YM61_COCSC|nr:hypothetical protein COCSUDRAFT_54709 [Coccomyxa subellipsoidea C-169]EIE19480.1 hypothetical protein COCSUDRAFT_54709 [Coccomyxa subellipsoidea C-169]|eukprot:XP_005644024.1 hypothetical protein COCSUDRAFT_54709 [Coccomyxa subellipsoidea C-169]
MYQILKRTGFTPSLSQMPCYWSSSPFVCSTYSLASYSGTVKMLAVAQKWGVQGLGPSVNSCEDLQHAQLLRILEELWKGRKYVLPRDRTHSSEDIILYIENYGADQRCHHGRVCRTVSTSVCNSKKRPSYGPCSVTIFTVLQPC